MSDTTRPWLTLDDLMPIFQITDREAAARLARQLGGVKLAVGWRVPPEAVDDLKAPARPSSASQLTPEPRPDADPVDTVPRTLTRGWLQKARPAT